MPASVVVSETSWPVSIEKNRYNKVSLVWKAVNQEVQPAHALLFLVSVTPFFVWWECDIRHWPSAATTMGWMRAGMCPQELEVRALRCWRQLPWAAVRQEQVVTAPPSLRPDTRCTRCASMGGTWISILALLASSFVFGYESWPPLALGSLSLKGVG